jgi:hypothetical protein
VRNVRGRKKSPKDVSRQNSPHRAGRPPGGAGFVAPASRRLSRGHLAPRPRWDTSFTAPQSDTRAGRPPGGAGFVAPASRRLSRGHLALGRGGTHRHGTAISHAGGGARATQSSRAALGAPGLVAPASRRLSRGHLALGRAAEHLLSGTAIRYAGGGARATQSSRAALGLDGSETRPHTKSHYLFFGAM